MTKKIFMRLALAGLMLLPCMAKPERDASEKLPVFHSEGMRFVDNAGREVILRGVNAGGRSKLPPFFPFEPVPDFNTALEKYADGIQSMGFNVVRLLIIYEAAEPTRGK